MTIYDVDVAVGDDGNTGIGEGAGNAFASIGKALQTVAAGDTIFAKSSGEYSAEDGSTDAIGAIVTAGGSTTPILVEGFNTTHGDGTFACVTLNAGTNALANCINSALGGAIYYHFKNFRFTGGSSHGLDLVGENTMEFTRCRSDNNGGLGFNTPGLVWFADCQSDNNSSIGYVGITSTNMAHCVAFSNGGVGFQIGAFSSITNCLSYKNTGIQIRLTGTRAIVKNCNVDGNNRTQIGIGGGGYLCLIENCIIYRCSIGIVGTAGSEGLEGSLNNLFFSNDTDRANWPDDPSDINEDPLFVDADNNDYRLGSGSPAIQGGIDAGEVVNGESFISVGALQEETEASPVIPPAFTGSISQPLASLIRRTVYLESRLLID